MSRTEAVFVQIRDAILQGRFEPGQRLHITALASSYGVSQSVVREALTRLAGQEIVTAQSQTGFRVAQLSRQDLIDLTEVRLAIEPLALRRSIQCGDLAWEARVTAAYHILERTPLAPSDEPRQLNVAWMRAHQAFHATLLSGWGNPRVEGFAAALRDSAELYHRWGMALYAGRDNRTAQHHELLLNAIARDEESASALLADHINRTTETILTGASWALT